MNVESEHNAAVTSHSIHRSQDALYFDTNTSDHHHFYVEGEDRIIDIPGGIEIENLPEPPPGMEIRNIDVMVWVKPSAR